MVSRWLSKRARLRTLCSPSNSAAQAGACARQDVAGVGGGGRGATPPARLADRLDCADDSADADGASDMKTDASDGDNEEN